MDHAIRLPSDPILWGKAQALNEKTVAGVGFLVVLMVVVGSIVIRLSLEVNARHKVDSARPVVATERSLVNRARGNLRVKQRRRPSWRRAGDRSYTVVRFGAEVVSAQNRTNSVGRDQRERNERVAIRPGA